MKTIIKNKYNKVELESKSYVDFIISMDRIFKFFLTALKKELINLKITDINNVQGLIVYNLGYDSVYITELISRGYYTGSNVSYNLKKLIDLGYIEQKQSDKDKRSVIIKLTDSGLKLLYKIERIFSLQIHDVNKKIKNLKTQNFQTATQKIMKALEELSKR